MLTFKDLSIWLETLKLKIESALSVLRRSDLEGVNGVNEMAFKTLLIGIFATEIVEKTLAVESELGVSKKDKKNGFADLVLRHTKFGTILFELKYLSLAYARDLKPNPLDLKDTNILHSQLEERKTNFSQLTKDKQLQQSFQTLDSNRCYAEKLKQMNIDFKPLSNTKTGQYFVVLKVEDMIKLAKEQASNYILKNEARFYAVVGVGCVFLSKSVNCFYY